MRNGGNAGVRRVLGGADAVEVRELEFVELRVETAELAV